MGTEQDTATRQGPAPAGLDPQPAGWWRWAVRPLLDARTPLLVCYLLATLPVAVATAYLMFFGLPLSLFVAAVTIVGPLVPLTAIRIALALLNGLTRLVTRNWLFAPDQPLPLSPALTRLWARAADPAGWLRLVLPTIWVAAAIERRLARRLGGVRIPNPYRAPTSVTLSGRYRDRAAQPATWRDLGYMLLAMPASLLGVAAVYLLLIVPLVLSTTLLWHWLAPKLAVDISGILRITADSTPTAALVSLIGLVGFAVLIHPVRLIARGRARLAAYLLGPNPHAELARKLAAQVSDQRAKRARAVQVADDEHRRIERDLHDGAQQRLVALALDLSRAKRKFRTDPEQAYALVDEAREEALRAIVELRNLARGIRPPILTDRGLDAAISALAGRATVPVEVDVRLPDRPPPPIESAAYFVVAEALTNVDKHARASRAAVWITRSADRVVLEIRDNGTGGATPARGSGLAGLADRVASLDGTVQITSPVGGPTIIHAELPCES